MDAPTALATAIRGRWAVAALFFINGFITGSWAPQIPVFLARLDISKSALGLLILVFGVGALTFMPISGWQMSKRGSQGVARGFGVAAVFGLLVVALASTVPAAAVAMFLFGGVIGGMDVAMNANAVVVEKRLARAVMSSSHGFWSLGGFAGGGIGGVAIQSFGHLWHAAGVTALTLAILALAYRHILGEDRPVQHEHRKAALPRSLAVHLVGIMALFCMVPEGAVLDWAALYLQSELSADLATAGLAFAFFSGAMAVMRFAGDQVRDRFGAVKTMRISSLVAASGMLVAGLSPWPALAIAAFAVSGLGLANMVPIAFSAAGNQPGMAPATGMSVVSTMGYSGILLAPSAIGFTADHTGFWPVFVAMAGLLTIVFLMSGLARSADFPTGPGQQGDMR